MTRLLPNGMPLTEHRLANGLVLYLIENHSAPVFTYQTWFRVGSKDEKMDRRIGKTGLAHLFEHMMFRGTASRPDGEFDRIMSENGVYDENATTWLDRTNYYQSLPADKLELVMELEAERMTGLRIHSELLETEKGAVVGERNMGLDDPDTVAYEKLYELSFERHPYRYSTIGTEEEIRSFTVEEAGYFYRRFYSPGNATLLIVGDVAPASAIASVEKYYGAIPAENVTFEETPREAAPVGAREAEITHPQLTQEKVLIAYPVPEVTHPDSAALWIAQSLLTLGHGSALNLEWVNQGIAVEVKGSLDQFRDPGLIILAVDLQTGHSADELTLSLAAVLGRLAGMDTKSFEREVERARNQLLLRVFSQWEDSSSLASYLGEFIITAGTPDFGFRIAESVAKSTAAQVRDALARYLVPERRTVVIARPQEK